MANNPAEVNWNGIQAEGHVLGTDAQPGLDTLQAAQRDVQGPEALLGEHRSTALTDTRFYGLYYGVPAFCFDPRADQIHGCDERVDLASMARVTRVFSQFIARWCGLNRIQTGAV